MRLAATYLTWIEAALVVVIALLAVVWAVRSRHFRRVKPGSQIIVGVLPFVAVWGVLFVTGLALNPTFAAFALLIGALSGFSASYRKILVRYQGRVVVRPSAVPGWISAIGWILVAASVAFLGPNSVSATLLIALFGAAMSFVETVTHAVRARSVAA